MYKSRSGSYTATVTANTDLTALLLPSDAEKIKINAFEIHCSAAARIQINDTDIVCCTLPKKRYSFFVAKVNRNKQFFLNIEKIKILDNCTLTLNYFYNVVEPIAVKTPVFSIPSGEVEEGSELSIICSTPDAVIYYTVDGVTQEYTEPLIINEDTDISAYAT